MIQTFNDSKEYWLKKAVRLIHFFINCLGVTHLFKTARLEIN